MEGFRVRRCWRRMRTLPETCTHTLRIRAVCPEYRRSTNQQRKGLTRSHPPPSSWPFPPRALVIPSLQSSLSSPEVEAWLQRCARSSSDGVRVHTRGYYDIPVTNSVTLCKKNSPPERHLSSDPFLSATPRSTENAFYTFLYTLGAGSTSQGS